MEVPIQTSIFLEWMRPPPPPTHDERWVYCLLWFVCTYWTDLPKPSTTPLFTEGSERGHFFPL